MVKRKANGDANSHVAGKHDAGPEQTMDGSLAEHAQKPLHKRASVARKAGRGDLMVRGKDLLSDEAGGVATAVAIGVGAALIEVELIPGLIIGAGAILLGKLFPEIGGYVRPAVKSVLRAGFAAAEKAREIMAEASEQVHDVVAEVKNERKPPTKPARRSIPRAKTNATTGELPVH